VGLKAQSPVAALFDGQTWHAIRAICAKHELQGEQMRWLEFRWTQMRSL
jgi:hypothetical protein